MSISDDRAIVGIDPTKRGIAFVHFDGGALRDWGTRGGRGDHFEALRRVLELCPAEVLVIEDPGAAGNQRRARMRKILVRLADAAEQAGVQVVRVSRREVRARWAACRVKRKDAIAQGIAQQLSALEPLVPRRRKVFMDEEARANIFDAASLVLHVFPVRNKRAGA